MPPLGSDHVHQLAPAGFALLPNRRTWAPLVERAFCLAPQVRTMAPPNAARRRQRVPLPRRQRSPKASQVNHKVVCPVVQHRTPEPITSFALRRTCVAVTPPHHSLRHLLVLSLWLHHSEKPHRHLRVGWEVGEDIDGQVQTAFPFLDALNANGDRVGGREPVPLIVP